MRRYNSREPVGHTCPDIDDIISSVEYLSSECTKATCDDIIQKMEKVRDANSKLRDWGYEESQRVDELEEKVSDLESEISTLEDKVEDLEKENVEVAA